MTREQALEIGLTIRWVLMLLGVVWLIELAVTIAERVSR